MAKELIINASLPETRISLMEDGEIQEILVERASEKGIVGNIYKGKVTRVLPGMQAAFVDIGLEKAAFLYVDDVFVHSDTFKDEIKIDNPDLPGLGEDLEAGAKDEPTEASAEPVARLAIIDRSKKSEVPADENKEGSPVAEAKSDEAESPGSALESAEGVIEEDGPKEQAMDASSEVEGLAENEDETKETSSSNQEEVAGDPEEESDDRDGTPVNMGPPAQDDEEKTDTVGQDEKVSESKEAQTASETEELQAKQESSDLDRSEEITAEEESEGVDGADADETEQKAAEEDRESSERGRRKGRRGGRRSGKPRQKKDEGDSQALPENLESQVDDQGEASSDRAGLEGEGESSEEQKNRPSITVSDGNRPKSGQEGGDPFKEQRSRDRRIRSRPTLGASRPSVNIQDLLKEGQEVLVQVAKDPIAAKGARLTCHISLPGRHLVCMPTIDHVGVSRRIEKEDERRRLRDFVEKSRPKKLGFIVRTASGKQQSEKRIKQDIEYLTTIWNEIRQKASEATAPALVYEDLNPVLRAVRDWVTEDINKIVVDSRYHFNDLQKFVSHFMPALKQKVELYHGDIPIFDAYGISTELSRALERKVWLKSGGYIVIDQAEALVAIDVNTGRYVGKRNLEDTIVKTNLEAVKEIAYQLRLRNCGGIIILDFIDMEKDESRLRVYRALEDALAKDRARPSILKISELGLVEMTRKRTRDTMVRALCESCSHCEGKGFVKAKLTVAYEVLREIEREGLDRDVNKILVRAHRAVIDILAIDQRETLETMEKRYRKSIYLQAVEDFHPEQFEVSAEKKAKSESSSIARLNEKMDRRRSRGKSDRGRRRKSSTSNDESSKQESRPTVIRDNKESIQVSDSEKGSTEENRMKVENQEIKKEVAPSVPVDPDSIGNVLEPEQPGSSNDASVDEDGFDEEDRLAFLRAQAAQDAALARLSSGSSASGNAVNRNRNDRGAGIGNNGRRGNRGRRTAGSRFRRGDRNAPRVGGAGQSRGNYQGRSPGGNNRTGAPKPTRTPGNTDSE